MLANPPDLARERPKFHPMNATLRSRAEIEAAAAEARRLRLPRCLDSPKSWDSLGMVGEVLSRTTADSAILDAGAEKYSVVLPWLSLYGYRNLRGANLTFDRGASQRVGGIVYEHGDITATHYPDASFDAIVCQSVIEHGVDLAAYFREMARLLKPGAALLTSTDYWDEPVDTRGQHAYGGPIRIFTRDDLRSAFALAAGHGLRLTANVDLTTAERAVTWREFDLSYTFVLFAMEKLPA